MNRVSSILVTQLLEVRLLLLVDKVMLRQEQHHLLVVD